MSSPESTTVFFGALLGQVHHRRLPPFKPIYFARCHNLNLLSVCPGNELFVGNSFSDITMTFKMSLWSFLFSLSNILSRTRENGTKSKQSPVLGGYVKGARGTLTATIYALFRPLPFVCLCICLSLLGLHKGKVEYLSTKEGSLCCLFVLFIMLRSVKPHSTSCCTLGPIGNPSRTQLVL